MREEVRYEIFTDSELFALISAGDEAAFEILFERYRSIVYTSAYKWTKSHEMCEEATQEIFIKLWVGRASLANVKDPASYIYRAVSNKVRDYLREGLNRERILATIRERQQAFSNITEEMLDLRGSERLVMEAVAQLSGQKRLIYSMNRENGKSIQQIAEELDISVNTVKTHLYEAIQFIRVYIKNTAILLAFVVCDFFK